MAHHEPSNKKLNDPVTFATYAYVVTENKQLKSDLETARNIADQLETEAAGWKSIALQLSAENETRREALQQFATNLDASTA